MGVSGRRHNARGVPVRLGNHPITQRPNHSIHGFTLIELLVVVSLIMLISTMAMTQYRNGVIHAREAVLQEDLFRLRDAIDQYYATRAVPGVVDALVSEGYVRSFRKIR